jgi:3',5'-cyclic AMP phosphodiesterase CpdA
MKKTIPGLNLEYPMTGPDRRRLLKILFLFFFIFSLLPTTVGGELASLPAQDWNRQNLQRLQTLNPETLTFAILGDNRGNYPVFEGLLRQMTRDPGLQFAIHLGDMVDKGEMAGYRSFFQSVRKLVKMPLLALIGNHELAGDPEGKLYIEIFGPRNFSFPLGSHYFIMFDDNAKSGPDAAQLRWLEGELQKGRSYRTRLVFLHIPLFDPRGGEHHHCLPPESASQLLSLFKKHNVTHIFAAHIHSYFNGRWDGVPYTISAGAGAKLYGTDPRHFFFHYLQVTLQGDRVQTRVRRLEEEGR